MQFLQPTQSEAYANAVPTHKLSGSEQLNPFGRSLRGAVARTTNQTKQARWTKPRGCLRILLCSFLGLEPKSTIQLDCNKSFKHSRSEDLPPKNFLSLTRDRQQRHCGRFCPPSDDQHPFCHLTMMTGAWSVVIIEEHRQPPSRC